MRASLIRSIAHFSLPLPTFSVLLSFLVCDALMLSVLWTQPLGIDWSPLHVAAHLAVHNETWLYDFQTITAGQKPEVGSFSDLRPFVYPPTALLVFSPFAVFPFRLSYLIWITATGALYFAMSSRLSPRWWLLPFFPPVFLAGLAGQTGFLMGGLSVAALSLLEDRPAIAGVMLGVATAIKPQLFILLPLAFIAARHWRALFFWSVTGAGMIVLALAIYGLDAWIAWFAALSHFETYFESSPLLVGNAVTPFAMAERMGWPAHGVLLALVIPALAVVWVTFREVRPPSERLIALIGGALLISPYAMNYELMLLAPALVVADDHDVGRAIMLLLVGISIVFGFGAIGLALALASLAWRENHGVRHA